MTKNITKFVKPQLIDVQSNYEVLTQILGPKIISDAMCSEEMIRMFSNENPYPPSPKVLQVMEDYLQIANRYPDPTCYYLNEKIAEYTGLKPENVIIGHGSLGVIELIYHTFVGFNDEVILTLPSFEQFEFILNLMSGKPVFIQLQKPDFILEPEIVSNSVSPKTKLIILINPNNPIGNVMPEDTIKKILDEDAIVVVDEAYYEFCKKTVAPWIPEHENLIVLRTFSKAFSLAGLRIGYGLANPEIIKELRKLQTPFPINMISIQAAIAALEDTDYAENNVSKILKERKYLLEELSKIKGIKPYPSETNFILIEITKENLDSRIITAKLLENKILIKNCADQKGLNEKFIRVSVSTPENNKLFIETLKKIIG
ncbi:MAG: histidinol-phosphate transaminase [Candidatus Jordarchaeum sp.]|uniref:histidinol-phosphate transaminase n=1 Tax=Candidatus Jordarchaeum sp. TaxID=2823881 RepID=UPI00404B258B